MGRLICKCGLEITRDDIFVQNGCNEEGEEYHEYEVRCTKGCNTYHEGSGWGEYNIEEVKQAIADEHEGFTYKTEIL